MNTVITKEKVYENISNYLTSPYSNAISGFHDLTGFWKKKEEILKETPYKNIEILYAVLSSDFSTAEEIHDIAFKGLTEYLKPYLRPKPGRKSDWEKQLRSKRVSVKRDSVHNLKFLRKVKTLAGLILEKDIPKSDIIEYMDGVEKDEMNSEFWEENQTKLSNFKFRIDILYSFAEGTSSEKLVAEKIVSIIKRTLDFHGVDVNSKLVKEKLEEVSNLYAELEIIQREFEDIEKIYEDFKKRKDSAETVYIKESNQEINGISLNIIVRYKRLLND